MKHTKGEWGVRGILLTGLHVYSKDTNYPIAVGIESKEDAQLIAAAPDLYEALKAINKYLETGHPQNMRLKKIAVVLLDKALALAEGKA